VKSEDEEIYDRFANPDGSPSPESEALKLAVGEAFIDDRRILVAGYVPEDLLCRVVGLVPVPRRAYERRDELKPLVELWIREFLRMNAYYLGLHIHAFELNVELCPDNEEDPPGSDGSPERGLR
jgi:hypothetical protein